MRGRWVLGLRLRSQMAFFLFALFGSTVLLITYFNVALLTQTIEKQAEQEALGSAVQVVNLLHELALDQEFSPQTLVSDERFGRLERYLVGVPRFHGFHLFTPDGVPVYRFCQTIQAEPILAEMASRAASEQTPLWKLWAFEPGGPASGCPFPGFSPFYRGLVSLEYFAPLPLQDQAPGGNWPVRMVAHISIETTPMVCRLGLIVVFNTVLAFLFVITGFIAINLWGEHAVNRPMTILLEAQERLGKGDYTTHVDLEIPSVNEVVVLTNSFNRMARDLQQYQEALQEKTHHLEEANQQFQRLNEDLEQKVEEKTRELREFFSMLTHDLRIPLAAIQGYAELLGRERQTRSLRGIQSANSSLLELVRNLLDAVRFGAGQVEMVPEAFDLEALLDEVVSNVGPSIEASRICVETDLVDGRVVADRTRIGRALTNLLANALSYSEQGHSVVLRASEKKGRVQIEVCDQGPGIAEENLSHIFEKFRHFPTPQGPSPGLGLGLYIVRCILEAHGGTISVRSQPGAGTCFYFDLPVPPESGRDREVPAKGQD
ncbi:MAG: ATP-binding protein [Candidatus Xenobium sp.]